MHNNLVLGLVLLLAIFFSSSIQAQQNDFLSRTTLEAGIGYHFPKSPTENIEAKDFTGFQSYYAGLRYQLNEVWGLRGTYAYHAFEHKDDKDLGLTIHKLTAEVTVNVIQAIQQEPSTPFDIIAHAGLGLSVGKKNSISGSDLMGNFQLGLMPKYHITEQLSMHLDGVYVLSFSQDYGYDGGSAKINGSSVTGGYFVANLGLAYKLN